MKIRTRGAQAFNVPNDPLGRMFLHLLKRYRNRGWYYRARGRGSRKEHGCRDSIPKEYSEWMAVYMDHPSKAPMGWVGGEPLTAANLIVTDSVAGNGLRLGEPAMLAAVEPVHFNNLPNANGGPREYQPVPPLATAEYQSGPPLNVAPPVPAAVPDNHPAVRPPDALCGCDPPAGFKCILHNDVEEGDEVELTQKEQIVLESILSSAADTKVFSEPEELREVFDSLYEKLVD